MAAFELGADDAGHSWTYQNLGPLPRLYEDAYRAGYDAQLRCYLETGAPFIAASIVRFVEGYVYARDAELEDAAEVRQRFLDGVGLPPGTNYYEALIRDRVIARTSELRRHPPLRAPLDDHLAHLRACIDHYAQVMGDLHWRMIGHRTFDWPTVFAELTGEPPEHAGRFTRGLVTSSTLLVRRLRSLARIAQGDAALAAAVRSADLDQIRRHRRFWSAFRRMMRRWGLRNGSGWGSKTDDMAPTWNLCPSIPLGMIARYIDADLDALDARDRRVREQRRRDERRVRRALRGQTLVRFDEALAFAQKGAHMMEDHNLWMDQCSAGLLREAAHQLGRKLVGMGRIDEPDDVLHLSLDELTDDDVRELVATRRAAHARREGLDPPKTLGAEPSERQKDGDADGSPTGLVDGILHGRSASAGRHTGPVRVLTTPDFSRVHPGDVLVTTDTGPDWTPLFALLGAVVLDRGNTWQHAAIVAREFGIPAVVETNEATSVLTDGQVVTVDGDTGQVGVGGSDMGLGSTA